MQIDLLSKLEKRFNDLRDQTYFQEISKEFIHIKKNFE